MSSSRQARAMRTAISPRLAMRMRLNMDQAVGAQHAAPLPLQWNISMLLRWIVVLFIFKHFKRADQRRPRVLGINHRIDVARLRGFEGVGESLPVVGDH